MMFLESFTLSFYRDVIDKKFKGDINRFVDDMFARSIFTDQARMNAFLEKPSF
jgi:hypothetical protein